MNFLKKNPFWLACIIALVVLLVVYAVLVDPKRRANNRMLDEVVKLHGKIERLNDRKVVPDSEMLDGARLQRQENENELAELAFRFAEMDQELESFIVDLAPGKKIPDGVEFKAEYVKRTHELKEFLKKKNVKLVEKAFDFPSWGTRIPSDEEIKLYQKRFWVQKAVAEIMAENNVIELKNMRFEATTKPDKGVYFTRRTFTLEVGMRYPDLLDLTAALLKSDRMIRTLRVKVERDQVKRASTLSFRSRRSAEKKEQTAPAESITLTCDYLDSNVQVQKVVFDGTKFASLEDIKSWADKNVSDDSGERRKVGFLATMLAEKEHFALGRQDDDEFVFEFVSKDRIEKKKRGGGLVNFSIEDEGISGTIGPLK